MHYRKMLSLHNLIFEPVNFDYQPGGNGMENDPDEIIIHMSKIPDDVYIPLLRNPDVIKYLFGKKHAEQVLRGVDPSELPLKKTEIYEHFQKLENQFLAEMSRKSNGSKSGKFGEMIFEEYMRIVQYYSLNDFKFLIQDIFVTEHGKKRKPEITIPNVAYFEVKHRTYFTPGTADEKNCAVGMKYITRRDWKEMPVICVLFTNNETIHSQSEHLPFVWCEGLLDRQREELVHQKTKLNLHYVKFTTMLSYLLQQIQMSLENGGNDNLICS